MMEKSDILNSIKKNKKDIDSLIKNNKVNDPFLLREIEKIFIKKRRYTFEMPKPGSPVISFMSGGLDTTVVIYMLLEIYKLRVFPIYINRGIPNTENSRKSALFFLSFFRDKFGKKIEDIFEIDLRIPPKELRQIVEFEREIIKRGLRRGVPLQPSIYAEYSFLYARYLELARQIKIRTIIGSWLYTNSELYSYESITSLRSIMLNLCVLDDNFEWQFTSLPMEKEMGFYFDKDVLIKIGEHFKLPLEKTWTCFLSKRMQCGVCVPCGKRRESFKIAGIADKTKYLVQSPNVLDKWVVKKVVNLNNEQV